VSAVYGVPSAGLLVADMADKAMSDDHVQSLFEKMHVSPEILTVLAGLALVHFIAHGRNA
jgi:hypothetical protein